MILLVDDPANPVLIVHLDVDLLERVPLEESDADRILLIHLCAKILREACRGDPEWIGEQSTFPYGNSDDTVDRGRPDQRSIRLGKKNRRNKACGEKERLPKKTERFLVVP